MDNILNLKNKDEFRSWLLNNSSKEKECFLVLKRGEPKDDDNFYYLDAVEVALCFGWIDSTLKRIDGDLYQRFSKRAKNSPWSELNKERVRRLIKLGLMTKEGLDVLPDMNKDNYKIDDEIINALKNNNLYEKFMEFDPLYQRVRTYNMLMYKGNKEEFKKAIDRLIDATKAGKTIGVWNDYGRLLNY